MKVLITGITGQDGSLMAKELLKNNYQVVGCSRNINDRSINNLKLLDINNEIDFEIGDLLDNKFIASLFSKHNFDEIYHFAAQSSVGLSQIEPYDTIKFNTLSTLNLLDSIKKYSDKTKLLNACSSEVFGTNNNNPLNELSNFSPISPYGLSKEFGYSTVKLYRETYDLFACNAILFNHESEFRGDDFFIKKLVKESVALQKGYQENIYLGNLNVKRDIGYAPDYMHALYLMLKSEIAKDYVIASGISTELIEIVKYVFLKLNISLNKIKIKEDLIRQNEIYDSVGNSNQIKLDLGWNYSKNIYEILDLLIEQELKNTN
jgi:GDPmannose 4,6-dehydratase